MTEVKHGGCYDCGSKSQPILTATSIPELPNSTAALCADCREKRLEARRTR